MLFSKLYFIFNIFICFVANKNSIKHKLDQELHFGMAVTNKREWLEERGGIEGARKLIYLFISF